MADSRERSDEAYVAAYESAPLVSVIIPCYKQAHFLSEAIESVLVQSYTAFEIVVIDDGSPDNTSTVAARYPEVRYIRQDNQGLSGARNTGIRASRGECLVFLDADDRLLPDALRAGIDYFRAYPECGLVSGHHRYIRGDGSLLNEYPPEPIDDDHYLALLKRNYIGCPATVLYPRAIFDVVGGFDTSLKSCEDYDLYLRIARRRPVMRHDRMIAEYRWHGANMTNNSGRMLQSALHVLRSQWDYIEDCPHYVRACRAGVRFWRAYFGGRLLSRMRKHIVARQWNQAAADLGVLAKFCPHWLSALALECTLAITVVRQSLAKRQRTRFQQ